MSKDTAPRWEAIGGDVVRTERAADGSGGYLIADLYAQGRGRPAEQRAVIAPLMAAAPELLDALRGVVAAHDRDVFDPTNVGSNISAWAAARDAIAKAEGRIP